MNEKQEVRGRLTLRVSDREGRTLYERPHNNRIVTTGRMLVAHLFGGVESGDTPTQVTHMAVGTNEGVDTPPADGDRVLKAQRGGRKGISEVSYEEFPEGEVTRVRTRLTAEFDFDEANGSEPLREAGVFTAAEGGVMYNRVVFDPVTKTEAFKLTLIWDIVF